MFRLLFLAVRLRGALINRHCVIPEAKHLLVHLLFLGVRWALKLLSLGVLFVFGVNLDAVAVGLGRCAGLRRNELADS